MMVGREEDEKDKRAAAAAVLQPGTAASTAAAFNLRRGLINIKTASFPSGTFGGGDGKSTKGCLTACCLHLQQLDQNR